MLFLLDSSAILNNPIFQFKQRNKYIITAKICSEFKDLRSRHLIENALYREKLSIIDPNNKSIEKIKEKAEKLGFSRLSKADISLLALALQFKQQGKRFKLVSDDYSIQNFCSLLKMPFQDVIHGKIKQIIAFQRFCPVCKKQFSVSYSKKECDICGIKLREKRQKQASIN